MRRLASLGMTGLSCWLQFSAISLALPKALSYGTLLQQTAEGTICACKTPVCERVRDVRRGLEGIGGFGGGWI